MTATSASALSYSNLDGGLIAFIKRLPDPSALSIGLLVTMAEKPAAVAEVVV